jgi:predicted metalloprotease
MDFDNNQVDVGGVEDRRGGPGRGVAIGGGGGIAAIVITLIVMFLNGGSSPNALNDLIQGGQVSGTGPSEDPSALQARCNTDGALDTYTDCRLIKVYDVVNSTWSDEFSRRGADYHPPRLVFFSGATNTGCGQASAQVGPFYCPADERIYLDLDFLAQLEQQFGIKGQFAEAYIVAHEAGHHLQKLLGTEPRVRQAQQLHPKQANELSVRLELQADCYAGVWSKLADQEKDGNGIALTQADVTEALNAAAAVGDDRIQKAAGRSVNPETWTHGSAKQRAQWFNTGLSSGDLDRCDTFAA